MAEPRTIRIERLSIEGALSRADAHRLGEELARVLARGAHAAGTIDRLDIVHGSNDPLVLAEAAAAELRRRLG